jgi:uncharacterized integral membrane protein (TIGR00698 family)
MNAALLRRLAPGFGLALAVAVASWFAEPLLRSATGGRLALPAMVIALVIGIGLFAVASRPVFEPGLTFCVKKLLRWAIGLLGLRIALGDIIGLGLSTALIVVGSMTLTILSGIWLARSLGRAEGFGALAGAACAVCGASATLATAAVVPDYREKAADIAFTVVMANAISTLVMLAYPPLCAALGLSAQETGVMLGATIHDMAQVVGAGYAVSDPVGNTAVIVKLFRVFLLLPVVLGIGWWFASRGGGADKAKVPVPLFAIVFLVLVLVNSTGLVPEPVRAVVGEASRWGLLVAIAALGLGTSVAAIARVGWRHVATVCATTVVILAASIVGLLLLR